MGEIYSTAAGVLVWVAKSDSTSNEAIEAMSKCAEKAVEELLGASFSDEMIQHHQSGLLRSTFTDGELRAITAFLQRTWFRRAWTLQEVLLTKKAIGYCGQKSFLVNDVVLVAAALVRDGEFAAFHDHRPHLKAQSEKTAIQAAALIGAYVTCLWPAGGFRSRALLRYPIIDIELKIDRTFKWLVALDVFVHGMRSRSCSIPGDKIKAPLAFAMHKSFLHRNFSAHNMYLIKEILSSPEESPPEELYRKFAIFVIASMQNLDILSRVDHDYPPSTKKTPDLPSWVPDYSISGTSSHIDNNLLYQYNATMAITYSLVGTEGTRKYFSFT